MPIREVHVPAFPVDRFVPYIGDERFDAFQHDAARLRRRLGASTVWNVNSTASGGGVSEMLHVLVAYARGAGLDLRWFTLDGSPEFFHLTKRLHHLLHGAEPPSDGGSADGHGIYQQVASGAAAELSRLVVPGDVVILHDPQTAGLLPPLSREEVTLIWRCHVGADVDNEATRAGWAFLEPYLEHADSYVFSRQAYIPPNPRLEPAVIVPPSIDPFAPKNQDLDHETVRAITSKIGLTDAADGGDGAPRFVRADGSPGRVDRRARIVGGSTPVGPDTPLVVQVSRWDPLKDMEGVLRAFAEHVDRAHLALVGPDPDSVSDDPEGIAVFEQCEAAWSGLPGEVRERIRLVSLPMEDPEENAVMVNAIQRLATVVVQKSLAEGFGLTVTEAMWKARPVVAAAVGGIPDQIEHGRHGLLVDPRDRTGFADAVTGLLRDAQTAGELGSNARSRVRDEFLCDRHLRQYAELLEDLLA